MHSSLCLFSEVLCWGIYLVNETWDEDCSKKCIDFLLIGIILIKLWLYLNELNRKTFLFSSEPPSLVDKLWSMCPAWEKTGEKARFVVAGFVFFMALLSVIFTLFPFRSSTSVSAANTGTGMFSLEELLKSYADLRHHGVPPVWRRCWIVPVLCINVAAVWSAIFGMFDTDIPTE